jgi:hypothetical protein
VAREYYRGGRLRSLARPFQFGGGPSGTGTGFAASTSVSPAITIPSMLYTHPHINIILIRTEERGLEIFQKRGKLNYGR